MANQYGTLAAPPTIAQVRQQLINAGASPADVEALLAQPRVRDPVTGQVDPAFLQAFAGVFGKRGPAGVGKGLLNQWLPWGFWDEHPTLARVLQFGAIAAPLAPLLLGAGAAGGAGAGGGTAAGTTSGVLPATATVPTATGTVAGLGASGAVPAATAGSSAATAAATAGTAAAATKGISSRLGPLLQYGIPTAGALAGAQIQSTGIKEAAEIQAKSFKDALEYEKQRDEYLKGLESQRYSDLTGRLQPYIAIGQTAADRMAALLGLNPSGHGYTPPPPAAGQNTGIVPTTQPSGAPIIHTMPVARTTGAADQPAPTGMPPMVTMRAPDGTTKVVPATDVAHYRSRGAEVING